MAQASVYRPWQDEADVYVPYFWPLGLDVAEELAESLQASEGAILGNIISSDVQHDGADRSRDVLQKSKDIREHTAIVGNESRGVAGVRVEVLVNVFGLGVSDDCCADDAFRELLR